MKRSSPVDSAIPLPSVTVKVEKESEPSPPHTPVSHAPVMGNGAGPVIQLHQNNNMSPVEHKPITLTKLMEARAQRNQDYYKATGIFSFELHRQTNRCDLKMPESPVDQSIGVKTTAATTSANMMPHSRSLSTSSSTGSLMNGIHSPHSMNGTPSPPASGGNGPNGNPNVPANQELPPACGAKQLSKLKRFLTTLQQFGSDISPEIGERVRSLVMGLVNNALTVEEFHNKLQEATNFPLRPFVIPFLKANLPLLQRELMHCARMAKINPQQYYLQHEQQILEVKTTPEGPEPLIDVNENGKRRSPDERIHGRPKENGTSIPLDGPLPKRHCSSGSPTTPGIPSSFGHLPPHHPFRVEDLVQGREGREPRDIREIRERLDRDRERHPSLGFPPNRENIFPDPFFFDDRIEDDWKHVETMLQCIVGMVEKTKRALAVLHQRSLQDREELSLWVRRHSQGADRNFKKRDIMALSPVDERVSEVKRRAEEAVNEVKRQAVSELQKAVAAAEQKANEMVSAERAKLDRSILEARQKATEDAMLLLNQQEDSSEVENCWNCGRKANETCSGCNTARYCGSFCQHKDWENHHRMCSQYVQTAKSSASSKSGTNETPPSTERISKTQSPHTIQTPPPRISPASSHHSSNSPSNSRTTSPVVPVPVALEATR